MRNKSYRALIDKMIKKAIAISAMAVLLAGCSSDALLLVGDNAYSVCYWEPAWIPVPGTYDNKKELWESMGAGWASSYASEYDPDDAGKWYGGSSWDNQAMFDFDGYELPSLKEFGLYKSGT